MLKLEYENSFKKDLKNQIKSGLKQDILFDVVKKLQSKIPLEPKYQDHKLVGNYIGFRECHVKSDLLLIYKQTSTTLYLARLGTHSQLFG